MRSVGIAAFVAGLMVTTAASAQHLWWVKEVDGKKIEKITFMYGEIEVLATGPTIYYCGVNWQPGRPAGGYCGIQDHPAGHRTIFSVWDTSPTLHPRVIKADKRTIYNRFGNEGSGSHTHMPYPWKVGRVFKYALFKRPDETGENTLTSYYFFDRTQGDKKTKGKWVLEATISSPTNDQDSVRYFGGGMNSFLENWSGKNREIPKVCLYRLWVGTSPKDLKFLRKAVGDAGGRWGILNGSYYLAEGDPAKVAEVLKSHAKGTGNVLGAKKGAKLPPIPDRSVAADTVKALEALIGSGPAKRSEKKSPQPVPQPRPFCGG